ncbi:hypothetical protein [Carboxylicivirga taeanensis]|uniref:hypothetical protein n=1 Tax=Carboxylicivirga taeanensis TaxID=1416875 RepID=UPI003F6DEC21
MKNISLLWVLAATICCLTSCSSYQFATLNSSLEQPFSDGFIYEDDSIQLHYAFNGPNCPLYLTIYNKLEVPVRIHWDQSSMVVDGATFPLNPSVATFDANYSEVSINGDYSTYTNGSGSGSVVNNDRSGFIPPKASLRISNVTICSQFLDTGQAIKYERRNFVADNGKSYQVKAYDFSKEVSPLYFRCFVSYSVDPSDQLRYVDNDFWVTSIYKLVDYQLPERANQFYLTKSTGVGTAVGVAALAGLTIIAIDNYSVEEEAAY